MHSAIIFGALWKKQSCMYIQKNFLSKELPYPNVNPIGHKHYKHTVSFYGTNSSNDIRAPIFPSIDDIYCIFNLTLCFVYFCSFLVFDFGILKILAWLGYLKEFHWAVFLFSSWNFTNFSRFGTHCGSWKPPHIERNRVVKANRAVVGKIVC